MSAPNLQKKGPIPHAGLKLPCMPWFITFIVCCCMAGCLMVVGVINCWLGGAIILFICWFWPPQFVCVAGAATAGAAMAGACW